MSVQMTRIYIRVNDDDIKRWSAIPGRGQLPASTESVTPGQRIRNDGCAIDPVAALFKSVAAATPAANAG
jgi:hypothetical protein